MLVEETMVKPRHVIDVAIREYSLVGNVMHREETANPPVGGPMPVKLVQVDRSQPGLPVVGVENVDRKPKVRDRFKYGHEKRMNLAALSG